MRCSAYCTATSFDIPALSVYLKDHFKSTLFRDVIHFRLESVAPDSSEGDVFIFPYAAVIFWGLDATKEKDLLSQIKGFEQEPVPKIAEDLFFYGYGATVNIKDDDIVLPDKEVLTKLAFSQAIAQSVKLDTFETTIQKTIDVTHDLPRNLALHGKISLSGLEMRKMMGRLFIDRHSINLHQELLDTPEFFWEYPELEPHYKLVAHYLDIQRRVNILNQRLTVLKELFDMLSSEINHKHSSKLEWTVIFLILLEVIIAFAEILHLV